MGTNTISGNISATSGGSLIVSNSQTGTITGTNGGTAGSIMQVLSSNTGAINASSEYVLDAVNVKIASGSITFMQGDVVGCSLNSGRISLSDGALQADTVHIIGNYVREVTDMILIGSNNVSTYISNNQIVQFNGDFNGRYYGIRYTTSGSFAHVISHNDINVGQNDRGVITTGGLGSFIISHNDLAGGAYSNSSYFSYGIALGATLYSSAFYNSIRGFNYTTTGTIDDNFGNTTSATFTDAGNPDPNYNDIDGTRADIGLEGGATPYSQYARSGYQTAASRKPVTFSIQAPRKVRAGQSFTIKAKAYDH